MDFVASFPVKKDADSYITWRGGDWILREKETGMFWCYGNVALTKQTETSHDGK
jgi:hypothetical protein